jgi:hypothetical protein
MAKKSATNAEKLAAVYLKIRNRLEEIEAEHKQAVAPIKEQLDQVSAVLLDLCNSENADSIKTPAGTIMRRIASRYWASDWDDMREFIKEHDAFDLLEKRIHNTNMAQFLADHPDLTPSGLQCEKKYVLQVRKPTVKG